MDLNVTWRDYTLMENKKPATKEDVDRLLRKLDEALAKLDGSNTVRPPSVSQDESPFFTGIREGQDPQVPDRLQ
ncbi:hypothetical protein AB1K83_00525 [Sporosarcina sp. 179-K 3D1 HS]|uniref:hypothetical protein n=1 Tax=Sporosarcina sp. 179-K 3D1 HS TaxID=3232169 RepID=UPI0039A1A1BB